MRKLLFVFLILFGAVPAFATNYYIDLASGSDAAAGTSTGVAWKHSPGMGGATGTAAAHTPVADDTFIFKGGITSLATSFGGLNITQSGTSGHPITYTTDHSWYVGGSFSKPVLDSEYMYNVNTVFNSVHWIVFNDIELKGETTGLGNDGALIQGFGSGNIVLSNLYIHGWRFTGNGMASNSDTDGDGANGGIIFGSFSPASDAATIELHDSIIENSENTGGGYMGGNAMRYIAIITNTTIHDVSSVGTQFCNWDGGSIYNVQYPSGNQGRDQTYHFNVLYVDPGATYTATCNVKNSLFYDAAGGIEGLVNSLANGSAPVGPAVVNIFNNVFYGHTNTLGYIVIDNYSQFSDPGGTTHIYNNLIEMTGEGSGVAPVNAIQQTSRGYNYAAIVITNNYFIGGTGFTAYAINCAIVTGTCTQTTNLPNDGSSQNPATATAQGYIQATLWAPVNGLGDTVDGGTDLSGTFTTDRLGVTRTAPWDIGPYQWVGSGSTYFVATTGNDSNPGTIGSPFLTIAKCAGGAASVMVAGDTCIIRVGTYNEAVGCTFAATGCPMGTSYSNAITIRAYPAETVTITKTGGGVASIFGLGVGALYPAHRDAFWILDGLIFDGTTTVQFPIAGLYMDSVRVQNTEVKNAKNSGALPVANNWEFLNDTVHDNGTDAQDHGLYWSGSGVIVDGGRYYNNKGLGIQVINSGGCDGTTDPGKECTNNNTVRNTRIYDNGLSPGGGGLILATGSNNLSYNNLIYNNTGPGLSIDFRCGLFTVGSSPGTPCKSFNDTIYGSSSYGVAIGANDSNVVAPVVENAIIYMNGLTILNNSYMSSAVLSNNLTSDPSFTNAGSADFTIPITSAARDYGLNLTSLGITALDTDFAGNARPVVAAWDAGAYQYPIAVVVGGSSRMHMRH